MYLNKTMYSIIHISVCYLDNQIVVSVIRMTMATAGLDYAIIVACGGMNWLTRLGVNFIKPLPIGLGS